MSNEKQQSQELAKAISRVVARSSEIGPDAVIAELSEIEAAFLPKVSANKTLQLETKRRVAEWKFKLLSERDVPPPMAKKLYEDVCTLGFTDLETEANIQIYYAQYLSRSSLSSAAKETLELLSEKLDKALAVKEVRSHRHLRQEVQNLLSTLKK